MNTFFGSSRRRTPVGSQSQQPNLLSGVARPGTTLDGEEAVQAGMTVM